MKRIIRLLLSLLFFTSFSFQALASLNLILPTRNQHLYEHPESFYMQTARSGADAWMGGMYGFSRNAKHVAGGTVNTRFHEGVDIAPMMRDERGEPLDTVMAIDEGTVVYVNPVAGRSNYGKYVIVRHYWNGSPFYSLYAHLNETWVDSGQDVGQGASLGRLGYTGDGINRARAHLHFEIAMLVNENFQMWYDLEFGDNANHHSFYNGMNLAGLNVARLYERLRQEPNLTIRQFLDGEHRPFYTILLPRDGRLDLLSRYPWLLKKSATPYDPTWEIAFDASGLPLSIESSKKKASGPTLTWIADTSFPYTYLTKSYVRGEKGKAKLTSSGERFMRLVAIEQDSTAPGSKPLRTIAANETEEEGLIDEEMAEEEFVEEEAIAEGSVDTEIGTEGVTGDSRGEEKTPDNVVEADSAGDEMEEERMVEEKAIDEEEGGMEEGGAVPADADVEKAEESVAPGSLSPGRADETPDEALASPYHTAGYFFDWPLDGIHWEVDMGPIVLSIPSHESKLANAAVDTVMARCDECARFGISQPRMFRFGKDRTVWTLHIDVPDREKLMGLFDDANGKVFVIELYIKSNEEESVSSVKMRTAMMMRERVFKQ